MMWPDVHRWEVWWIVRNTIMTAVLEVFSANFVFFFIRIFGIIFIIFCVGVLYITVVV